MPTLTIAEIAKRLRLPESTVRYYRDHFAPYVPVVGEGRQRRYPAEALEVFRVIADGMRKNRGSATEVEETLSRIFPRNVESTAIEQQATTEPQQSLPQLAEHLAIVLTEQRALLAHQSSAIDALQQEMTALKEQLAQRDQQQENRLEQRDAALLAAMRRMMAQHSSPSLWQRLFRIKPPREED